MNRFRLNGVVALAALVTLLAVGPDAVAQKRSSRPSTATTGTGTGEVPKKVSDAVVLEVGREKFSVGQIAEVFQKNANRGGKSFYELERDSALAFLDLYARYRLKVQAALEAGLDRKPELIAEIASNRMQLAIPPAPQSGYLVERKVVDRAVERIFKLREDEVKVSVIFSAMRANDPADTMRAFRRTVDMLKRISLGEDFGKMVFDSSDDRSLANAGGEIWVTGGMLFPEMEAAAYETKPGQVYDGTIRVPSGFVILKVLDRRPRERVRASHIFFEANTEAPADARAAARQRAEQALARLKAGDTFETVAREMSDDKTSGANGGDLGSFYTRSLGFEAANGRLWPVFETELFKLRDGQVSEIVETNVGYHIIRRVESRRPEFADERETIRQMYKQRFLDEDRAQFVREVIAKQGFRMNDATLARLLGSVKQTGTSADTAWSRSIPADLRSQPLFTFNGTPFTVAAWIDSIESRRELRVTPLHERGIRNSITTILEPAAMAAEARNLEAEYPEFDALMKEFRDGILIFKLEEDLIWSRLKYDEEQGKAFWVKSQSKYMTEPKLALTELFLYKEDEMKAAQALLAARPNAFDSLAAALTQRAGYRDKGGKWALSGAKNADLVRQVLERAKDPKPGTMVGPFAYQGGHTLVRIDQHEAPRTMTYEEARPEVMSDFIDYLQKKLQDDWIDTLKLKHRVKIDDRALSQALAVR
jgi:peptidyl-prolyl cis-trans isomerase SurA